MLWLDGSHPVARSSLSECASVLVLLARSRHARGLSVVEPWFCSFSLSFHFTTLMSQSRLDHLSVLPLAKRYAIARWPTSTLRLKYLCGRMGGKRGKRKEKKRCKKGQNQRS